MNEPKISVITPVYNAEKCIGEAVESILGQTFKDFEYIVIDDGSTDNTAAILNSFKDTRLKIIRNEKNLNQSNCRNIGIREARGKYCAFMDADDVSLQDRLQKLFDFLENNPDVGIVGGTMEIMSADKKIIGKRRYALIDTQIRKRIFWFSPFCHPSILVRKSILEKIGGYDEKWSPAEDYEIYFRIGKYTKFANLEDILLRYRVTSKSLTTGSTNKMFLMTLKIREAYANEYPYKMGWLEKIYNLVQYLAVYILPVRFKIWLFHIFRDSK